MHPLPPTMIPTTTTMQETTEAIVNQSNVMASEQYLVGKVQKLALVPSEGAPNPGTKKLAIVDAKSREDPKKPS